MTVLGASLDLATKLLTLDSDKAASYREQVTAARGRKSMRLTDFQHHVQACARGAVPTGRAAIFGLHVYRHATVREEERNESSDRSRSSARLGLVAEGARRPE